MKSLSRRDYSILIGNAVDHFDTALYAFLAPLFAPLFFPSSDPIISLILAYSVLSTSIITKPLGSYIFSMIALTSGPASSLSYSLIGIGIATLFVGLVPGYLDIGVYAPILLIIIRFFAGIFSAGEITIAKLYVLSNKTGNNLFKSSYLYQTSVMIGIVAASFISSIVIKYDDLENWRLCFIAGGITALFGYVLRIYKTEKISLNTKQILSLYSYGATKILYKNKVILLKVAITTSFAYITYSIPFIVMNNLVPEFSDFSLDDMMSSNTILLLIDMILLPIIGYFFIKLQFSLKKTLVISVVILAITIIPLCNYLVDSSFSYIIFTKMVIIIIGIIFSNHIIIWQNSLINGMEKYLIIGVGSSIGSATIGKTAPAICLGLYNYMNSPLAIGWFVLLISLGTIWAIASTN